MKEERKKEREREGGREGGREEGKEKKIIITEKNNGLLEKLSYL